MAYILCYKISDYEITSSEAERFKEEKEMHDRVNELFNEEGSGLEILFAGNIHLEFEYKPIEVVTKLQHSFKK